MRYLTIILAVAFGMMLSWIMLLNQDPVRVILDTNNSGWIQPAIRFMPLWQVILWSVFVGILIGFLLSWSGGADHRRRLRDLEYDRDTTVDEEPDYVVGLTSRRR